MPEIALYGREDGLFEPRTDKGLEFVKDRAGKMVLAKISANTRSDLQNRYLWGWVYYNQICRKLKDAGITVNGFPWTKDTLHAAFQSCFLIENTFYFADKVNIVFESTSKMSSKRFTEYLKDIKEFVFDTWEITIDDPRDGMWLEIMREIQR